MLTIHSTAAEEEEEEEEEHLLKASNLSIHQPLIVQANLLLHLLVIVISR